MAQRGRPVVRVAPLDGAAHPARRQHAPRVVPLAGRNKASRILRRTIQPDGAPDGIGTFFRERVGRSAGSVSGATDALIGGCVDSWVDASYHLSPSHQ
jgi:hypothetical protein